MKSMDDLVHELVGFVGILQETLNIFRNNRRLMASITIITLLTRSLVFLTNFFSAAPVVSDLIMKVTMLAGAIPLSPEFEELFNGIKEDLLFTLGLNLLFIIFFVAIRIVSVTAIIYASSKIYHGNCTYFPLKELLKSIAKSWLRPCVSWFYITLFAIGYYFEVIIVIYLPLYVIFNPIVAYLFLALAVVFYKHLSVIWILSLVISVLEENCYGIEALGRAGKLVKGMKLQGFVLNLVLTLLSFVAFLGLIFIFDQSKAGQTLLGLLMVVNLAMLVEILGMTAYTVFYYLCKKAHGEEVELQGNLEYNKLGIAPLITDQDLP